VGTRATIAKVKSEIELARIEVAREGRLVKDGAGSQRELDVRRTKLVAARANLEEAQAAVGTAVEKVSEAEEKAAAIQTRIDDATLTSPVTGRVLYRLAEVGEVLPPGGRALTLVNLLDVYMEIFLPSREAAQAAVGSEARITLDYEPNRTIAGYVSFVSPEAQFTPKQVETRSEREKLMFRVKLQVPAETASQQLAHTLTGVRGVGYVKLDKATAWPSRLQKPLVGPASATVESE
jgi:HlyD family secretion protein